MTHTEVVFPASFAQQRMWFLHRLHPDESYYNSQVVLETTGPIVLGTLQAALRAVVDRHEILRTTFRERDGELTQVVSDGPAPEVRFVEMPGAAHDPEVAEELLKWIRQPFDLEAGPLLRCVVLQLDVDHQLLLFVLHHIIADGWTLNLLAKEVGAAYRACAAGVPWEIEPLEIQYADFADWQREQLRGEVLERELSYWREQLGGELPLLELPTDRPRPDELSTQGAREDFELSAELTEAIRKLGRAEGVTPFMVLLAAFGTLLRRYSGQDDVVVGSPVACRESDQVKPLLGLFMNTMAMRLDLSGAPSFREVLRRVREVCLGAYTHQDLPLDKIVDDLRPPRHPGRSPLFDVLFAVQNPPRLDLEIPGVRTTAMELERFSTRFDLELHFWEHADRFTGAFVFATALFDRETVRRLTGHLQGLLAVAAADPDCDVSRLPLAGARERDWLLSLAERKSGEDDNLAAWFVRSTERHPSAEAIVLGGGQSISYAELNERANRLANHLRGHGAGIGSHIGIHLERGPDEVVATLAVLKLGGVCVALDPAHPPVFQRRIAAECVPELILTADPSTAGELAPGAIVVAFGTVGEGPAKPVEVRLSPDAPAFALWTPQGVRLLDHGTLCRQLRWLQDALALSEMDTAAQTASPVLVRSVWERFGPLLAGAKVVVGDQAGFAVADRLYEVPEGGVVLGVARHGAYVPGSEAVYVLDEHGDLPPAGARGEICFGPPGAGPDQAVRTGDFGRWTADGRLTVLETSRHRMWAGGFPVDPADLAATVLHDEAVQDCVILPARNDTGNTELIAYVVPSGPLVERRLVEAMRAEWPAAVVPAGFVPVSAIPLRDSGVVDEAELNRLPVPREELLRRWEDTLAALPGVDRAAVVVAGEASVPEERIHLGELLAGTRLTDPEAESVSVPVVAAPAATANEPAISLGAELGDLGVYTLPETLRRAARDQRATITYLDGDSAESHTYPELLTEASRLLGGLRRLGLRPGDEVIFQLERNPDVIVSFWACVLGGFVPVPMAIPPTYEVADSVVAKFENAHEMFGSPWVLTSAALANGIRELAGRREWPGLKLAIVDELRGGAVDDYWHPSAPDDPAFMLLTSGSTGRPKAVVLNHRNVLSRSAGTARVNGFRSEDVSFNWMPLDHVGGIQMSHIRDVYVGCSQVHAPIRWVLEDPLRWLDCVDRYRASITWAPNFAFGLINDRAEELAGRSWDLSCLRHILNAGEAISAKITRRFLKVLAPLGLPSTAMNPEWGMSETSSTITYSDCFSLDATSDDDPFVEVGGPYPGAGLRIVGDDGLVVLGDRVGRLQVSGPTVTSGYYQNPEQNKESFTDDGWFETGDLGYLRDGVLTITGRAKDVVIINGVNYYSHEIEAAVEELEAVENSYTAACGVRDGTSTTDQVAVFFHLRDGFDEARTIREARGQVMQRVGINPAYLIPVTREAIPKTEIGKIQRTQLRNRFHDGEFAETCARVDLLLGNERTLPNWFYRVIWRKARPAAGPRRRIAGHTLVLLDRHGLGDQLCAELGRRGERYVRAEPGRDFAHLFDELAADNIEIDRIVDLGGYAPADQRATEQALEQGRWESLTRLSHLVKSAAGKLDTGRRRTLYVVTSDAVAVGPDEMPACERLALAGFVKSVDQEIHWLRCRHIDLTLDADGNVGHLLSELDSTAPGVQVAYRGDERWVPRLARLNQHAPVTAGPEFQRGALYLMSGGLGEVGVEIADHLLSTYGVRLLVLGRTELAHRIETYRRLRARGDLVYAEADVCDETQVRAAVEDAESRWSTELAGVLHLAGQFGEGAVTEQTDDELASVLAPKVRGAWVLHQLVKDRPGALFVSFSSVNGFFGGATVSAYSAANAFLDSFATYQRRTGLASYSLAWSMWDELGMSRGYALKELTKSRGFTALGRRQAVYSFLAALRQDEPHVLIGLDGGKPGISSRLDQPTRPLTRLIGYVTGTVGQLQPGLELTDSYRRQSRCELVVLDELPVDERGGIDRQRLSDLNHPGRGAAAAHVEPGDDMERLVASIWSRVLEVDRVGMRDNFFELQGNSLLMTRAHGLLERAVTRKVSLVDLFRYPTPATLAAFLSEPAEATTKRGKDRAERRMRARGQRAGTGTEGNDAG